MLELLLLQTVVSATYAASYLAVIAVGLVLIFGVMGVINFAQGWPRSRGGWPGRTGL